MVSPKPLKEIFGMQKYRLLNREIGYAYLDNRHWFYPTKFSLLKLLKEEGFNILETNNTFSMRLSVYAQKATDR